MTGRFATFDARPGGSYRLVLTYSDPEAPQAKSTDDSDTVDVRYRDIVPKDRIVQAVDFVPDTPGFAGTMKMTRSVREEPDGSRVESIAGNVTEGSSVEDHAAGRASSLHNLAVHRDLTAGSGDASAEAKVSENIRS